MAVNPQHVRTVEFATVKKGLNPDEVGAFLAQVADDLEKAQNHATAMEARARAAVQRVQELAAQAPAEPIDDAPDAVAASVDEAETISRTLLLAQRTADNTVAEATAEATKLRDDAMEEATRELDAARELAAQMTEAARDTARQAGERERQAVEQELNEMQIARDALAADVDALRGFLDIQRERLRDAATTLMDLTERVPGGIAPAPPPVLQTEPAAAHDIPDDVHEVDTDDGDASPVDVPDDDHDPVVIVTSDPDTEDSPTKAPDGDDPTPVDPSAWSPEEMPGSESGRDLSFNFTDE